MAADSKNTMSRFEYDDVSTLTTFNFYESKAEIDQEGVLSKFLSKFKTAVSGPHSPSTAPALHYASSIYSTSTVECSKETHSIEAKESVAIQGGLARLETLHLPDVPTTATTASIATSTTATAATAATATTTTNTTNTTSTNNNTNTNNTTNSNTNTSTNTTTTTSTNTNLDIQKQQAQPVKQIQHQMYVTSPTPPGSMKANEIKGGSMQPLPDTLIRQSDMTFPVSRLSLDSISYGNVLTKTSSCDSDTQSVMTTFSVSNSNSLGRMIGRLRGEKPNTDYWMPDEQCKECFECSARFSLFRRKHHCRICGQIFCAKCASHIIQGERISQGGQVRVCNFCFSKLEAQEQDDANSINEAYMYSGNRNSADFDTMVVLPPVLPDHKPLSTAPTMQIPTTTLKKHQSEYGGEDATTLALEIPTRELISYTVPSGSYTGQLTLSPGASSSLQHHQDYSPHHHHLHHLHHLHHYNNNTNTTCTTNSLSGGNTSNSMNNTNNTNAYRLNEPDTGFKKLLMATNTLLRPRSRTNTMNSLGIDTSISLLEGRQPGSPVPFRRNSLSMNSPFVDGGGGALLLDNDYTFGGSDTEDDDPKKWDKSPKNLLNFLGNNERSNPTAQLHAANEDNGLTSVSPASGKGESNTSDEDMYDQRIRLKRMEDIRTRDRSSAIRRRLSMSGVSSRPIRTRTRSLMRNAPITTANVEASETEVASVPPDITPGPSPTSSAPTPPTQEHSHGHGRTRPLACFTPHHRRVSSTPLSIELNASSLDHMRKLLRHMLSQASPSIIKDTSTWEDVLMNLLLKVSDHVNPDIRGGDEIDIRHYVKVKKIAGGQPKDSHYIKGVVCSKNVAHKHMLRTVHNPQILILLFPLEWSRDSSRREQQLQSIDPVLAQEKDYLEKLVNRIVALKPSIVLFSSNVSRLALDFLVKANIVVAYNVKLGVLDAVARCTGASIISSFIQLNKEGLQLGHCGIFETKTLVHEWIPNRRKTFLMFHQCPPDLGATIILRGGRVETLRVIKRILDFMVFVVHNLKLESFLMRDFTKMRNSILISPVPVGSIEEAKESLVGLRPVKSPLLFNENEELTMEKEQDVRLKPIMDMVTKYQHVTLSASPMAKFPPPYLLQRLKETQQQMVALIEKRIGHCESFSGHGGQVEKHKFWSTLYTLADMPSYFRAFDQTMLGDTEYDQALEEHHHRWRALEACIGVNTDTLSPFYHQQLVVLYACICTETTVSCQGPEMRLFEYYRPESDMTLGQYIEDTIIDATGLCPSTMCDRTLLEHCRSYAHGNAKVIVQIQRFENAQPMMATTIMTWSYCKHCTSYTSLIPISENSWKYSFGKILELMFYQSEQSLSLTDQCPHTMYRDHVHYFGFKGLAVRFHYETIELLDVYVPPMHLYINPKSQTSSKDTALELARTKIAKFYESVVERNRSFSFDIVQPNMVESCKESLQEMSRRATEEKKQMLQYLQSVYATTAPTDTISLNIVRIPLQMNVLQWDLKYVEFVRQYVRPERELRRLTASHLKRMLPAESMISIVVSSLDLRTKRATAAADLPMLDVGLEQYETNCHGVSGLRELGDPDSDTLLPFKQQPSLGESPTTASPWLEEETRLNCLLKEMDDRQLEAIKKKEQGDKVEPQWKEKEVPECPILDPSVARRLSLELMKDIPNGSVAWQNNAIKKQKEESKRRKDPPMQLSTSVLERHAAILPLLSPKTYIRIAAELLPDNAVVKSKSSPSPISNSILTSRILLKPSHTTTRTKYFSLEDTLSKSKSTPRRDSKGSEHHGQRNSPVTEQPIGKKELTLNGYCYGYKGSIERVSTTNKRSRPRPSDQKERERRDIGTRIAMSPLADKPKSNGASTVQPQLQLQAQSQHPPQVKRTIQFSKQLPGTQKKRALRQRLSSRSSIEVYQTIRELVREESEDEFQVTDVEDHTDAEDPMDAEDEEDQSMMLGCTFSLTRTDEYDESFGREVVPPHVQQQRRFNREQLQMFGTSLPHLSLDSEDGVSDRKNECDSLDQTMPDYPMDSNTHESAIEVGKTNTLPMLDASSIDLSGSGPERNSFIKTITNMLAEKGLGNLAPLDYPLSPLEHVFPGSPIIVGEDEPSTIIAYSLSCADYLEKLQEIRDGHAETTADEISLSEESERMTLDTQADSISGTGVFIERTLRSNSGNHMKYYFTDGTTKFFCKIFFVEQFDALRRNCGCDESYIGSLASCCKWDSSGGKSGSIFLKTKDDRFLIKQISKYEMDAFLRFAPSYFKYMSEAFFHELPTVLCKIFGLYRIGFKNASTGKSMTMDILVMENLFYQRVVKKIFDLKGSMRNRHVQETGKENEVLLDENMVELMFQSPLFLRSHSKEMLRGSLHNDTLFLSRLDVMDYSLLVGVDEEKQELVVGIVDFIRTFTWDKKLESWVKESGILGGGGKEPTIISPRQYRLRFREAMDRYFLMVPDFWTSKYTHAPLQHYDHAQSIHRQSVSEYDPGAGSSFM
ncbi:hypothetical protein BDF14DRAFT_1882111 [Spinellus fusiger]|nr:hypothetical protein BDF14DRAFT_1882111 [Spinellus fusiger]